jgi:hypothetical protein
LAEVVVCSHCWRLPDAEAATMKIWPFVEPVRETIVDGELASSARGHQAVRGGQLGHEPPRADPGTSRAQSP